MRRERSEHRAFEREAKIGMDLCHPNLVRVHEYVKDPRQPFFVMDHFAGYHLKLPIARPSVYPMPKTQLHRIMEQAALGLAYMHDEGMDASRRQAREHPGQPAPARPV